MIGLVLLVLFVNFCVYLGYCGLVCHYHSQGIGWKSSPRRPLAGQ